MNWCTNQWKEWYPKQFNSRKLYFSVVTERKTSEQLSIQVPFLMHCFSQVAGQGKLWILKLLLETISWEFIELIQIKRAIIWGNKHMTAHNHANKHNEV